MMRVSHSCRLAPRRGVPMSLRLSGINISGMKFKIFVLMGFLCGVAGLYIHPSQRQPLCFNNNTTPLMSFTLSRCAHRQQ